MFSVGIRTKRESTFALHILLQFLPAFMILIKIFSLLKNNDTMGETKGLFQHANFQI